jgi:APA family basic amino acid/polyamine antiporter
MMGLGSIVGTGVFVSIGIAAGLAGPAVVLAIALAAAVAVCNALSSAQLAASHPVSGGTYEYGYKYLNPWLGFAAGWMFLCAKSASAATAALGFAGYLLESSKGENPHAIVAIGFGTVIVLGALVAGGVRQSNRFNIAVVTVSLLSLVVFIASGASSAAASGTEHFRPFFEGSPLSFFHATALMFVAYTGYGRIATLGEEVRDPQRTIPRAIIVTLAVSALVYIGVAVVGIGAAGVATMYESTDQAAAPLAVVAQGFEFPLAHRLVAIGAMAAMLGVLLNLLLGLSRVLLAMGRRRDMPHAVATLNEAGTTPYVAVIAVTALIATLTLVGSVKTTWSFSAFTVLVYYGITNLAALYLPESQRLYPRWVSWAGLAMCPFLAFCIDWQIWLAGLLILCVGGIWKLAATGIGRTTDHANHP